MQIDQSQRYITRLTRKTLALILAGGRGSRLKNLTEWRAKPAVPFGGKFRIIDFPLSNCVNSDIKQIAVLTQYKSHSLIRHIQKGWSFFRGEFGEFVELLPASQRLETSWYNGTADAVYQNLDIIRTFKPDYILILAGDHVYKMDYAHMLAHHFKHNADMTVACIDVPRNEAHAFGVMTIDQHTNIINFTEKPENPDATPYRDDMSLVSMGIYVFNTEFLINQLIRDADSESSSHDFGKDIIPDIVNSNSRAIAYPFHDEKNNINLYWRDVGTVDAYYEANMELISVVPELNLYDNHWPIWTYQEQLPPAKFVFNDDGCRGIAVDSMVSGGCIISGAHVNHSVLFSSVTVEPYSRLDDCVILPDVHIGKHCKIKDTIIDKGCRILDGTVIGYDDNLDSTRFHITESNKRLVTPEMLGQQVHHAR